MLLNRKQDKIIMRPLMFIFLLCLCLFFFLDTINAYAESSPAIISSKTDGEDILIYYFGSGTEASEVSLQIGNTSVDSESLKDSLMVETGFPIHTVLLLDNSLSLKRIWEKNAKALMTEIIDGHAPGELFQLATFAEKLSILSDFTDDYEGLKTVINDIVYINQDSYLTDILYDMTDAFKKADQPYYVRIIVICDGSDHNEITYTKAELTELLNESGIPVYAIGAANSNNSNSKELELLFSFSRASGGKYVTVTKTSDTSEAKAMLDADYSIRCLRASLPWALKDGLVKAAKLILKSGSEEHSLTANITMPFGVEPEPQVFTVSFADENGSTIFASVEVKEGETPVYSGTPPTKEEDESNKYMFNGWTDGTSNYALMDTLPPVSADTVYKAVFVPQKKAVIKTTELLPAPVEPKTPRFPWVILIAVFVVLAAVIAIVAVVIMKGRQSREEAPESSASAEKSSQDNKESSGPTGTVLLDQTVKLDDPDKTVAIKDGFITLTDTSDPSGRYSAYFRNGCVRIGRVQSSDTDIVLSFDKTVSGTHCEILAESGFYYLRHLGTSNPTIVNGSVTVRQGDAPVTISSGDSLTLGSRTYKIEISH